LRSSNTSRDSPIRKLPLVLWLALSLSGSAYAIDPNRAMSQYIRDRWGTEQGFPRGPVYAIAQSNDGYLWIGTSAGLVRFDGLKFRFLRDVPGLQDGESVVGLMRDGYGNLWIRTEGNLLRYRRGLFDSPAERISRRITAMSEAKEGNLLISVMGRGTMMYRQGKLEMMADASALPRSPVLSIAQTADGNIWSGTRGGGLYRRHDGRTDPVLEGLPDLKVNCLQPGAKGDLWIGTDNGIVRWNGRQLAAVGPALLHQFQVLAIERDRDGNIWAGTGSHGLLRINEQGVAYLAPPGSNPGTQLPPCLRTERATFG
jgi:ligand-binding sensor domain-containing protein